MSGSAESQQKFLETNVTYEQLADLERQFEDVEVQIIREQDALTRNLYEKRQKLVAEIPNFWPLVFEQAPPEIDEHIQPKDSMVLLTALKSFSVSHFEAESGDPRSVSFKFEFEPNDFFADTVLEKKFWYRRSKTAWSGLVSEPVEIRWKQAKNDLTEGLLTLVKRVWDESRGKPRSTTLTANQKALKEKLQDGPTSFFAWFGYIGKDISAEESRAAVEQDKEIRRLQAADQDIPAELQVTAADEQKEDEEDEDALEIFPEGDTLAIALSDDLWPGALKYFTQAQEGDMGSDFDFESSDEEGDEAQGEQSPPAKKRKV